MVMGLVVTRSSRSHRDFRNREAAIKGQQNQIRLGARSHRDFRNREAEIGNILHELVWIRAVTATSGIVRRHVSPQKDYFYHRRAVTATSGIVRRTSLMPSALSLPGAQSPRLQES